MIISSVIILVCFVIGIILEKLILPRFKKLTAKTKWMIDDLIVDSVKGMIILLLTLLGVYIALVYLPLTQKVEMIVSKVLLVLTIFSATIIAMKFFAGIVAMSITKFLPARTGIFRTVVKIVILVIGVFVILNTLGVSISPMLTAFGIGGLAVALALQDTLSNLFAGVHIIAVKQMKPGNYIKLETGEEGYIVDIGWRNTTIRMLQNNLVIVPNNKIASSIVTNYYLPDEEMAVLIQVGVSYDSDLEKVEKVTIEVAEEVMKEVPGGVPEFKPFIRYHTFHDFSINFTVIMRCRSFVDQYLIKHEFIKRLHRRYKKEGIEIPFPIRTIHIKGGSK